MEKDISIIISTYNSPDWLANVLYGYNTQTYRNFEVINPDFLDNDVYFERHPNHTNNFN